MRSPGTTVSEPVSAAIFSHERARIAGRIDPLGDASTRCRPAARCTRAGRPFPAGAEPVAWERPPVPLSGRASATESTTAAATNSRRRRAVVAAPPSSLAATRRTGRIVGSGSAGEQGAAYEGRRSPRTPLFRALRHRDAGGRRSNFCSPWGHLTTNMCSLSTVFPNGCLLSPPSGVPSCKQTFAAGRIEGGRREPWPRS